MGTSKRAQTVREFCEDNSISRSMLYKAVRENWGPRLMKVGRKTLITDEAGQEWRTRMEREAAEKGLAE